jgi:hypothetical protein
VYNDEGYEVAKSLLATSQKLYSVIWSDQPPLHTWLISFVGFIFGQSFVAFRAAGLGLFSLSLGVLAACTNCRQGSIHLRLATLVFALASSDFGLYGLSVTIMLPALGFGLWAVWLWQRFGLSGNRWWLFGSGIVFGLGFQTKFTVLLFLPALAVEFIRHAWRQVPAVPRRLGVGREVGAGAVPTPAPPHSPWPSPPVGAREGISKALGFLAQWSGIWVAGFVYGVALVWAIFPEEDLVWLLKYHFRPEVTVPFESQAGLSPMLHKLVLDWPIAGFAVLGLFLGLVQRRWAVVFPTVFFFTSFLAHAWHRPWWDYYYLHLSIPMAWLGALGVQWTWETLAKPATPIPNCELRIPNSESASLPRRLRLRLLEFWPGGRAAGLIAAFSFCLAGFLVELPERYERETAFLRAKPSPTEVKVLAELKERRADTRWLYTDRPIWCAHANILIPPELAVLSLKRIASGDITHAEFLRLLHHYRPEQILLQRRHFEDEKFHEFLRAFYDVVIEEGNLKYLVRRDWEAARKQKRAGKCGMETARHLAMAATLPDSPSPRPSPPVGAREKRAVEWVPAAAVSLPSERRLEAAGTWSFASIRVFREHLGGQAG